MRYLAIGGAGFIGSNVVRRLLEYGHRVTILDNLSTGYAANLEPYPDAEPIADNIRDGALLNKVVSGKDAVFHLAASVNNKKATEEPHYDTFQNVISTVNLLEAMRRKMSATSSTLRRSASSERRNTSR
jgi:nucleoside-diphosphate-sugar epimerase